MSSEFKLPFDNYDFFGYLLPGTLLSLGMIFVFWDKIGCYVESYIPKACSEAASQTCSKVEVDGAIAILFALITMVILYFLGHIVGCIAHLIYDRMIVRNMLGYPFYNFLKLEKNLPQTTKILCFSLATTGFVIIVSPIYYLYDFSFQKIESSIYSFFYKYEIVSFFILLSVIAFFCFLFSLCSKKCVWKKSDFVKKLDRLYKNIGIRDIKKWSDYLWTFIASFLYIFFGSLLKILHFIFISLTPLICEKMVFSFRLITATYGCTNKVLRKKFLERLSNTTDLNKDNIKEYDSDIYWLAYMGLVQEKDGPHHDGKIINWLCLYGCLRNYSCAFLMMAAVASFRLWMTIFFKYENIEIDRYALIIVVALLLSFLLFMRYWIMYCAYYSKYIIRAYAVGKYSK